MFNIEHSVVLKVAVVIFFTRSSKNLTTGNKFIIFAGTTIYFQAMQ